MIWLHFLIHVCRILGTCLSHFWVVFGNIFGHIWTHAWDILVTFFHIIGNIFGTFLNIFWILAIKNVLPLRNAPSARRSVRPSSTVPPARGWGRPNLCTETLDQPQSSFCSYTLNNTKNSL